jgi:hypothetical protein
LSKHQSKRETAVLDLWQNPIRAVSRFFCWKQGTFGKTIIEPRRGPGASIASEGLQGFGARRRGWDQSRRGAKVGGDGQAERGVALGEKTVVERSEMRRDGLRCLSGRVDNGVPVIKGEEVMAEW